MFERIRDQHGATLVLVALGIIVFLGMVALAVDLGMALTARTESQRTADAAALAGAGSLITQPDDEDRARQWAIDYAAQNTVLGRIADMRPEDVDVLLDEDKVRVRVYNVASRSNAIKTIFGRALGWQSMDVSTVAAAEASSATQTRLCPLPIALPDRWLDGDDDALFTGTGNTDPDVYIPLEPKTYVEGVTAQIDYFGWPGEFTGYYEGNLGDIIEIKTASNAVDDGDEASPCVETESWRCWFQPLATNGAAIPDSLGNDYLRPWIWGCPDGEAAPVSIGDWVYESSGGGDKQTLLHNDFAQMMNLEPDLYFDDLKQCVLEMGNEADGCVEKGYRVRSIPVIDPTSVEATGANLRAQVSGLTCVFLEQVGLYHVPGSTEITPFKAKKGNWSLYIRMIPCAGMGPSGGDGTIVKTLRLVRY